MKKKKFRWRRRLKRCSYSSNFLTRANTYPNICVLGCVCLEVKYGRWKTLERKWKWKLFRVCLVGWRGRKINGEVQMFSLLTHQKVFSPKWRENWREKLGITFEQKCPCIITPSPTLLFFTLFFLFFLHCLVLFFFCCCFVLFFFLFLCFFFLNVFWVKIWFFFIFF